MFYEYSITSASTTQPFFELKNTECVSGSIKINTMYIDSTCDVSDCYIPWDTYKCIKVNNVDR